jgi:hypothetical protein
MIKSIKSVVSRCRGLFTSLLAAVALLSALSAAPAQAAMIGNTMTYPDLTLSYLTVLDQPAGIMAITSPVTPFDLLTGPAAADDVWVTGAYYLTYDRLLTTGTLLIMGAYDQTGDPFGLMGHIVAAGSTEDGKAYDFLVQLDVIDQTLIDYGFGGVGSLIYTNLLLNGDVWQSDTVNAVPEPSTLILLAAGLLGLVALRRRLA